MQHNNNNIQIFLESPPNTIVPSHFYQQSRSHMILRTNQVTICYRKARTSQKHSKLVGKQINRKYTQKGIQYSRINKKKKMVPNPVEEIDICELINKNINITKNKNDFINDRCDLAKSSKFTISPIPEYVRYRNKSGMPSLTLPSLSPSIESSSPRRTFFDTYWRKEDLIEQQKKINGFLNDKKNTKDGSISPLNLPESPSASALAIRKTFPCSILRRSVSAPTSHQNKSEHNPSNLGSSQSHSTRSLKCAENSSRYKGCLGLPLPPSFFRIVMPQHHDKFSCCVHFDPLVSVVEYQGDEDESHRSKHHSSRWFTEKELDQFKAEAIFQARKCPLSKEVDSPRFTGITTACASLSNTRRNRALFTHPALRATPDELLISDGSYEWYTLLEHEIKNILIVQPNEQFQYTLKRTMQQMMPNIRVETAKNSAISLQKVLNMSMSTDDGSTCSQRGFDIIIVEERLGSYHTEQMKLFEQSSAEATACFNENCSGSQLLLKIAEMEDQPFAKEDMPSPSSTISLTSNKRIPLLIGVSSHLGEDGENLSKSGADLLWGSVPSMNHVLRNEILNMVLSKRGRNMIVCG